MTKDQVRQVLDRVLTWAPDRQEDAAQMLLAFEADRDRVYYPDDDESAAIEEGLAQVRRGEAVPDEEIARILQPRD